MLFHALISAPSTMTLFPGLVSPLSAFLFLLIYDEYDECHYRELNSSDQLNCWKRKILYMWSDRFSCNDIFLLYKIYLNIYYLILYNLILNFKRFKKLKNNYSKIKYNIKY